MRLENDDGLSELLASGEETRLCTGFEFTEGPIWVAADEALLFSDIPGNRIHRWRPGSDAAEVYREPSGHSNGLTLDADGQLLACEHSGRRVSRATYVARGGDGAGTDVVAAFEGKRFNSPNDLVMHSSGRLYFTDPTYGLPRPVARRVMGDPDARKELDFQGVYLFDADGTLTLLVDEFTQPNGLAFSPDEEVLYVGDSQDRIIRRYEVANDGSLSGGELFADMRGDDRPGAPDGMKERHEQSTEPGRVRPHLQHDAPGRRRREAALHGLGGRPHPRFLDHRPARGDHAALTPRIPDVDPNRPLRRSRRCTPCHAGLLPAWADPGRARLATRYVSALREETGLLSPAFNPSVRGSNPRGPTTETQWPRALAPLLRFAMF